AASMLLKAGVDVSGNYMTGGTFMWQRFGSYLAIALMVLYLGRRFYWAIAKQTVFIRGKGSTGDVLPREVWAARLGVIACVLMVIMLWRIGLHPALGAGFVLLTGLMFMMLGRINAATGLFLIQPFWNPVVVMLGLFGASTLGPQTLIILAMLVTMISIDTRIAVVPLALNALRLGDRQNVKPGKLAGWLIVAVILALIGSMLFTVWLVYDKGVHGMDSAGTRWALEVARMPFKLLERNVNKLTEDQLEAAAQPLTLARLAGGRTAKHFYTAMAVGLVLVFGCSWLRLRFPGWPLHPVLFLVWGNNWMTIYAPSFMLAWLLKNLILKYGGQKSYARAKGFFVGLVAGEFAAAMIIALIAAGHYLDTGTILETFLTRP
ncbi:hypothetical protein LCGC14_2267750, partial [marine sediment metagenome]